MSAEDGLRCKRTEASVRCEDAEQAVKMLRERERTRQDGEKWKRPREGLRRLELGEDGMLYSEQGGELARGRDLKELGAGGIGMADVTEEKGDGSLLSTENVADEQVIPAIARYRFC